MPRITRLILGRGMAVLGGIAFVAIPRGTFERLVELLGSDSMVDRTCSLFRMGGSCAGRFWLAVTVTAVLWLASAVVLTW